MLKAIVIVILLGRDSAAVPTRSARNDSARAELARAFRAAASRMAGGEFVTPLSKLFAPTGVYVNSEPLSLRGPASARAWLMRDTLNPTSTARWTILRHDVSVDGRDGYSYGYLDVIRPNGDTLPGKYHAYWRRDARGTWQLLAFSRGRRAPGPVTETLPSWLADSSRVGGAVRADTVAMLREIMETERAFAADVANVGTQTAFMKFAAPDGAKLDRAASYAFGRRGIGELFAGPPPGPGPFWTPEVGAVAASGDLGFTTGPITPRAPGGPAPPPGAKYFTIWRRMPGGEWRYVVD